MELLIVARSA